MPRVAARTNETTHGRRLRSQCGTYAWQLNAVPARRAAAAGAARCGRRVRRVAVRGREPITARVCLVRGTGNTWSVTQCSRFVNYQSINSRIDVKFHRARPLNAHTITLSITSRVFFHRVAFAVGGRAALCACGTMWRRRYSEKTGARYRAGGMPAGGINRGVNPGFRLAHEYHIHNTPAKSTTIEERRT